MRPQLPHFLLSTDEGPDPIRLPGPFTNSHLDRCHVTSSVNGDFKKALRSPNEYEAKEFSTRCTIKHHDRAAEYTVVALGVPSRHGIIGSPEPELSVLT